jgi:L-lactate dehydrogenase complex protein LldE
MVRHSYTELFAEDETWLPRAKALAERTYELTEYLVDVRGVTDLGARFPGPLTYHSSCHLLRELGVERQPKALLGKVADTRNTQDQPSEQVLYTLPHADNAGFGSVFCRTCTHLSKNDERKIANIESTALPAVVCDAGY